MAENTPKLAYLLDPLFQIENVNGKPLVGGYIEVYYAGTNEKYITYQNFDFTQNPFKIPLGSDGRAVVLAQTEQAYDVYVRDSFGNLVFSRLNIAPGGAGGVAFGMTKVSHDDTLTGNGTQLSPLGVSPLTNLAVDETMTAYEATVEGKESIVLGVNGDWFNSAISGISNDFVTNETFSACCSAVKGGLDNKVDLSALNNYYTKTETWNTFLPRSGLDLSNYYTTAQTYNKYEIEDRLDGKQDRLTFGYDENSAISSINNSALAGSQGGDTTPWISGTKHIADTQLMTDNMLIQVLSSFDLSGNKNHCINVKGGMYRFPNQWELASSIQNTNWFMEKSAMSGYFPTSSFNSFIENGWNPNINALYSSASNLINSANWLINNKLDASAFSAYTADAGETYTLVGGDNISISSDDDEKTTTISVTGEVGDTTPWISGAKILAETKYMEPGEYIQALSSFTLSGNKNHCIAVKGGGYLFPTNQMLASGISSYLTGEFVPSSTFSSFVSSWSDHLSTLYGNDSYLSSCVSNISANKLDSTAYHELTAGTNIDIQNYVISSKDWTNEIKEASANAFNEATAANPTSSTQWNSCYETVNTNSGEWQKVSGKLDTTAFESYTANDETYLLKGGYNIGVSSDDVNKETTIYYTGTNGDEQVNQVVRQYSAAGTWLTAHQDISNLMPKSESANFYPMTGNPSGFLTQHQDLSNYATTAQLADKIDSSAINYKSFPGLGSLVSGISGHKIYAYTAENASWADKAGTAVKDNLGRNITATYITTADITGYVPYSAVSALIDVVQTYSGKWLLNGDL